MIRKSSWLMISAFVILTLFHAGIVKAADTFLMSSFIGDAGVNGYDPKLYLWSSADGTAWSSLFGQTGPFYDGSQAPRGWVRDPAIMQYNGNYYVAHTSDYEQFSVIKSSDLTSWSKVKDVSLPTLTTNPIVEGNSVWVGEWFIDSDGSPHLLVTVSTDFPIQWNSDYMFNPPYHFRLYEIHPTNSDFTEWSNPVQLTGNLPDNIIDATIVKIGGVYHLFYKNENNHYTEYATSSALTGDYTVQKSGNWAGWGDYVENVSLVKLDNGAWRMYFVNYYNVNPTGVYYSDSTDNFATWSQKSLISIGGAFPNGASVIRWSGQTNSNSNTNTNTNTNTNSNSNTNANSNVNINTNNNANTNTNTNSSVAIQTISGSVETSQALGLTGENSVLANFLAANDDEKYKYAFENFQIKLLKTVIEQIGTANYPNTYAFLKAMFPDDFPNDMSQQAYMQRSPGAQYATVYNCAMVGTNKSVLACLSENSSLTSEVTSLKGWLAASDPTLLDFLNKGNTVVGSIVETINSSLSDLVCKHINNYVYTFEYDVNQSNEWKVISNATVNKCEEIKLKFTPNAEWLASYTGGYGTKPYTYTFWSPPTNFLDCSGQDDCLSKATEHSLTSDTFGKGSQRVSSDFIGQTQGSLSSSDAMMRCANGVCISYTSGSFPLSANAAASSYFGQCRGYGATVNTPEVVVPVAASNFNVSVSNRAPVPTVSFAKNPIGTNEEVNVTCDIVDPDECSDKIVRVRWICTDSNGNSDNCFLWKSGNGQWSQGSFTQDLIISEQSNPYQATAIFKAGRPGSYAVTCEATDNDANNPLTGTGINGIVVGCGADGYCNPSCPNDPDCGVVAARSGYCAIISGEDGNGNTICGENGQAKYEAYFSGIEPKVFNWKCSNNEAVQASNDSSITCSYDSQGSYLPTLSIVDKKGETTECVTQASTEVTGNSKCEIQIRKADTGDDYKSTATINEIDQLEALISKQCLSGGIVKWEVDKGRIVETDNNNIKVEFDSAGSMIIKAQVTTPDGKTIECEGAQVKVNDKVQIGI